MEKEEMEPQTDGQEASNRPTTETDAETPKIEGSVNKKKSDAKTKKILEKRKAFNDDNDDDDMKYQSKRKYQPTLSDDQSFVMDPEAEKGECKSSMEADQNNDQLDQSSDDEMNSLENRFTWIFWTSLHENYGSNCGYAFGFLVTLLLNFSWMLDEIGSTEEGHSVSKTFVIMFILYSYSFITFGLELVQFTYLFSEIYVPYGGKVMREYIKKWDERYPLFKKMRFGNWFYPSLATLFCMLQAFIGSVIWNWFWWNHICKAYHDRICKKSWIGKLVIAYRDDACYDGVASPIICEKFVSYLPILLFGIAVVFVGNVLMPLINDRLSLAYMQFEPFDIDAALDILQKSVKDEDTNGESTDEVNSKCSKQFLPKKQFNFSSTVEEFDTSGVREFRGGSGDSASSQ